MIFLDSIAKKNYLEILKTFFIALVFLALGSFIGVNFIPYSIRYMLNIAFFILILVSAFTRRGGFVPNKVSMNIYAFILGILTGSTYVYYFYNLGAGTFISIVIGVVLIFGISYLVALNQSEDLMSYGEPLGEMPLRVALQEYSHEYRGVRHPVNNYIIGAGFQILLYHSQNEPHSYFLHCMA